MISHCLGNVLQRLSRMPRDRHDALIATLPTECSYSDCTTGMGCRDYVAALAGSVFETRRRKCEARYWLRRGHTSQGKVDELVEMIALKRGHPAAELLRDDMREEWKHRARWMGSAP